MKLRCDFCYRHCQLEEGQTGLCGVRTHKEGKLITSGYGALVSLAVDPVEKKPLYHFLPGSRTMSIAMFGCNLTCQFCQNYLISQSDFAGVIAGQPVDIQEIIDGAKDRHCPSISFTYSEPLVWQDYMLEVAKRAKQEGLATIMVTNGTFSEEALARIVPWIDAYNIDLKGDESFYHRLCGGSDEPVLEAIRYIGRTKAHLEVTTMVMESMHTLSMIETLAHALHERGVQVWHLSRFFPNYHCTEAETSESFLRQALEAAKTGSIPYIYAGNSGMDQSTYCPSCHELLVTDRIRSSIHVLPTLKQGRCSSCRYPIYGRFGS